MMGEIPGIEPQLDTQGDTLPEVDPATPAAEQRPKGRRRSVGEWLLHVARRVTESRVEAYNAAGEPKGLDSDQASQPYTQLTEIDPTGQNPQRVVARLKNGPNSLPSEH